jgi:Protein of unknown function (DUF5656)
MKLFSGFKKRYKRWDRKFALSKRQQFVIITIVLSMGLVMTQLVGTDLRYSLVAGLSLMTYALTAFGLREDLRGIEWITLLTLPSLFTAAVASFYFLLPTRWLTRVPIAVLYAIGMYALLLTENIYNVAADRTIALLRAAHSVGFLLTLGTYFLLVQTVLAFRLPFYFNALIVGFVTLLLSFQAIWSSVLEERVSKRVIQLSLVITIILGQIIWIFSFWPTSTTLQALFATTSFYSVVGMAQLYVVEKLYKKNVIEFFSVNFIVFIIVMITTHWRGNL